MNLPGDEWKNTKSIPDDQWQKLMGNAVHACCLLDTITPVEAGRFHISIKAPIDELEMDRDTFRRMGGKGKK